MLEIPDNPLHTAEQRLELADTLTSVSNFCLESIEEFETEDSSPLNSKVDSFISFSFKEDEENLEDKVRDRILKSIHLHSTGIDTLKDFEDAFGNVDELFQYLNSLSVDADLHTLSTIAVIKASFTEDLNERLNLLNRAMEYNTGNFIALNMLGKLYFENSNFTKARECFSFAHNLIPEDSTTLVNLGFCYLHLEKIDQAINCLTKAIKISPFCAEAHSFLGVSYFCDTKFDLAFFHLKQAAVLDPQNSIVNINLAACYLETEENEKAIYYYRKALQLDPENYGVQVFLGTLLFEQEKYNEAREVFLNFLSVNPNDADSLEALGVIEIQEKNYEEAKMYFRKALLLRFSNVDEESEQVHISNSNILISYANFVQDTPFTSYFGSLINICKKEKEGKTLVALDQINKHIKDFGNEHEIEEFANRLRRKISIRTNPSDN